MSKQEQEFQLRNSRTYDDSQAAGVGMETPAAANQNAEWDLNNIRSQLKRVIDPVGATKWLQDMAAAGFNNFGLKQIHDKPFAFRAPFDAAVQSFNLGGVLGGVLVDAAEVTGATPTLAVGPSSEEDGGYISAAESLFTVAGTLGIGLSVAIDGDGNIVNKVDLVDAATNDPILDAGAVVFGLFQSITGAADGALVAGDLSENAQISFAKIDPATDVIVAATLPAGDYHFALVRLRSLFSLQRGSFLANGSGEILGGGSIPLPGYRVIKIVGPGPGIVGPAANDPLNIQTGAFTTGGAQTVLATSGTPALPATGALFRDEPRVSILRNGVEGVKESSAGGDADSDVYWVSATQVAFKTNLRIGEFIHIRAPESY